MVRVMMMMINMMSLMKVYQGEIFNFSLYIFNIEENHLKALCLMQKVFNDQFLIINTNSDVDNNS